MSETITPAPVQPAAEPVAPAAVAEVAAVAPAVETAAPAPAAEPFVHTDTPTLLETTEFDPKPAEPAQTEPKPDEPAQTEPKPPEAVTPEPIVYDFKLPEGVEPIAEQIEAYTGVLREAGIKPDIGQKLLDMHADRVRALTESSLAKQHEVFSATRREWQEQIKSDPELGGAASQTVQRAVARARDLLVPERDRPAFNDFLRVTGAGDHPAFWRALYRAAQLYDEPAPVPNVRPSPTANPAPRRGVMGLFAGTANNSFASR